MAEWQRVTANGADFELKILPVGTFENVVYIVRDPRTKEGYVIDAGWEPDTIAREVEDTNVRAILITHGHGDHHDELDALKGRIGAPSGIGELDQGLLHSAPDFTIYDRQELRFGGNTLRAIHTPGHTPGSTCFTLGNLLFSGDTLFPGGVGNTKNKTGHFFTIIQSVRYRLFSLPDDTVVYPGHGTATTIGTEKPHLDEWIERGW
ncbi:MAG: MBL fold metallo-hydrolase [Chloroflexi bacterium]|nr:MBL fold metallo-hydrolase [Chloroflexota bacterium]